jgi:hypothetical protein
MLICVLCSVKHERPDEARDHLAAHLGNLFPCPIDNCSSCPQLVTSLRKHLRDSRDPAHRQYYRDLQRAYGRQFKCRLLLFLCTNPKAIELVCRIGSRSPAEQRNILALATVHGVNDNTNLDSFCPDSPGVYGRSPPPVYPEPAESPVGDDLDGWFCKDIRVPVVGTAGFSDFGEEFDESYLRWTEEERKQTERMLSRIGDTFGDDDWVKETATETTVTAASPAAAVPTLTSTVSGGDFTEEMEDATAMPSQKPAPDAFLEYGFPNAEWQPLKSP